MVERDKRIPDLVSKAEAAEILGMTPQAVQKMIAGGRLKGAMVGKTWVFRRAEVERMAVGRAAVPDEDRLLQD
jgi:excisionase family DNA binding protein